MPSTSSTHGVPDTRRVITIAGVCSGIGGFDLGFLRANAGLHEVQFRVIWTCELDPFARAVLQARFPDATHYTDMMDDTLLTAQRPDIFVGGTPCQGFSVAGLRAGLNDNRSNLCLRYVTLANALAPRLLIWENVPGVLSMSDNAFGQFLAGLVAADTALLPEPAPSEPGKRPGQASGRHRWTGTEWRPRWTNAGLVSGPQRTAAWRVIDAQYLGVAQRRNRVFLVASPGDVGVASHTGAVRWGRDSVSPLPATLLFEPEGLRRDTPPRRQKGESPAPTLSARTKGGGGLGTDTECDGGLIPEVFPTLDANHNRKFGSNQWVNNGFALVTREPCVFDPTQITSPGNVSAPQPGDPCHPPAIVSWQQNSMDGSGTLGVDTDTQVLRPVGTAPDRQMIAFPERMSATACASTADLAPALGSVNPTAVAFDLRGREGGAMPEGPHPTANLRAASGGSSRSYIAATTEHHWQVRRLTPRECERLQGFHDDHTLVPINGKPMSDSQRYKQLGNAVCANVAHWLAHRIARFFPL